MRTRKRMKRRRRKKTRMIGQKMSSGRKGRGLRD